MFLCFLCVKFNVLITNAFSIIRDQLRKFNQVYYCCSLNSRESGWGSKLEKTECRMADVAEFRNFDFFYFRIFVLF